MPYFLVTLCCTFAALGSFLFGYDSGVISSSIEQDAFLNYFGSPGLSDAASGGIISSYTGIPLSREFATISPSPLSQEIPLARISSNLGEQEVPSSGPFSRRTSPISMDVEWSFSSVDCWPRWVRRSRVVRSPSRCLSPVDSSRAGLLDSCRPRFLSTVYAHGN